tara:strand:- start:295 stop:1596 length:1302 start_codon:yes stop_codon:yes gene_type:complete
MSLTDINFQKIVSNLESWANFENSSKLKDISKLESIQLLLSKLDNPEKNFRIIHIAGTNGKGSTALIISRLLKFHGFSTGCYTSPHIIDIRERIRINGRLVSKKNFVDSASIVLKKAKTFTGNLRITFFDLLTAIAFHVFMKKKMEWIVLETGLGGRLDSTNVTNKELCILTKVGFDHQDILGENLKDIAKEKIGITRSQIPIIISKQENELKKWLKKKLRKKSVPYYFADDYYKTQFPKSKFSQNFYSEPQFEAISLSLCAMQILFKGNLLKKKKWFKIAKNYKISGRLDLRENIFWVKNSKSFNRILIDGSHNKDSIFALIKFIAKNKIFPFNLILGMASDKLVNAIKNQLTELCLKADKTILTPINSPRTATTKNLESFIIESSKTSCFNIKHVISAEEALENCILNPEKSVVIAGSFYLVGEVLRILKN